MPGSPGKKDKGEEVTPAFCFLIAPAVFILDRVSKAWVLDTLAEGESLRLNFFFHLTRVNNTGAAFGLFKNLQIFLIIIGVVCVAGLMYTVFHRPLPSPRSRLADTASLLIAGGALGNLHDRVRYGYVVDFLDFRVWPVFNVADSAITIGVGLALLHIFKKQTA